MSIKISGAPWVSQSHDGLSYERCFWRLAFSCSRIISKQSIRFYVKFTKEKTETCDKNIVRDFKGCPVSLSRFTQSIIKVIFVFVFVFVWVLLFLFVFVYAFVYSLVVLCLRMTLTNCQKGQRSPHQPCIALKTLKSKGFELSWAPGLGWAAQTYI